VFFLRHEKVRAALEELRLHWSAGGAGVPRGPSYWPPIVQRRRTIFDALRGWVPPPARVILDVAQLRDIQDGEILVAPFTSTSWTPAFVRIAAAVTNAGGVKCHAAIVAREYALPAVLGTGVATKRIATGDVIRVDGNEGVVTVLRRS
jgi:pyruvate,water dikinase